jgi:hypothetical protein
VKTDRVFPLPLSREEEIIRTRKITVPLTNKEITTIKLRGQLQKRRRKATTRTSRLISKERRETRKTTNERIPLVKRTVLITLLLVLNKGFYA